MSGIKRKITHPQTTLKAIRIVRSKRFKIETREKLEAFLKEALRIFDQSFLSLALTPAEKLLLTYYSNLFQSQISPTLTAQLQKDPILKTLEYCRGCLALHRALQEIVSQGPLAKKSPRELNTIVQRSCSQLIEACGFFTTSIQNLVEKELTLEEAKNYTNALTRIGLCYQKLGQFKIAQSTSPTFISAAGAYYSIARTHLETAETLCMRISARAPAKTLMGESMKMQNEVKKLIEINESLLNGLHTDYGFDAKDLSQDQLLSYRYEGLPAKAPSIISSDQKLSLLLLAAFTDEYLASPQSSTELSPV